MRSLEESRAGTWAIVVALAGCGPTFGAGSGSGGGSGSASAGEGSGSSSVDDDSASGQETSTPAAWPEDSYGAFYWDSGVYLRPLGNYGARPSNLELSPDGLIVTHVSCLGESYDFEQRFEVEFEGAEAHVRPLAGETMVMWHDLPLAAELVFRPGATCRTLLCELIDPEPSAGDPEWQWKRGALIVTNPCNETPADVEWSADLDPDVPTDCPAGG